MQPVDSPLSLRELELAMAEKKKIGDPVKRITTPLWLLHAESRLVTLWSHV